MEMGNPHDVGTKVGMAMTIIAIGAISGPPISGAINTASGGYKAMGYYAGEFCARNTLFLVELRLNLFA